MFPVWCCDTQPTQHLAPSSKHKILFLLAMESERQRTQYHNAFIKAKWETNDSAILVAFRNFFVQSIACSNVKSASWAEIRAFANCPGRKRFQEILLSTSIYYGRTLERRRPFWDLGALSKIGGSRRLRHVQDRSSPITVILRFRMFFSCWTNSLHQPGCLRPGQ